MSCQADAKAMAMPPDSKQGVKPVKACLQTTPKRLHVYMSTSHINVFLVTYVLRVISTRRQTYAHTYIHTYMHSYISCTESDRQMRQVSKPRIDCIDGCRFALVFPIVIAHFARFAGVPRFSNTHELSYLVLG